MSIEEIPCRLYTHTDGKCFHYPSVDKLAFRGLDPQSSPTIDHSARSELLSAVRTADWALKGSDGVRVISGSTRSRSATTIWVAAGLGWEQVHRKPSP